MGRSGYQGQQLNMNTLGHATSRVIQNDINEIYESEETAENLHTIRINGRGGLIGGGSTADE